jgi:hypothetical protein
MVRRTKKTEAIEHAKDLATATGKPWVVYHSRHGGYRNYSLQNLSRLKRAPHLAGLPRGKVVYLARGRRRTRHAGTR